MSTTTTARIPLGVQFFQSGLDLTVRDSLKEVGGLEGVRI